MTDTKKVVTLLETSQSPVFVRNFDVLLGKSINENSHVFKTLSIFYIIVNRP